jgi:hypothetical protein
MLLFDPIRCMTYSNNCALPQDTKTNNNTKPDPESISIRVVILHQTPSLVD